MVLMKGGAPWSQTHSRSSQMAASLASCLQSVGGLGAKGEGGAVVGCLEPKEKPDSDAGPTYRHPML